MKGSTLKVENLHVQLNTELGVVRALNGVNFSLKSGKTLGLIGETGSGKSLTSRSILRLLPKTAQIIQGQILFSGRNLFEATNAEMQKIRGGEIALIYQEPGASLNPVLRVGDQIKEAIYQHKEGFSSKDVHEKMLDVLEKVAMPNPELAARSYPHELSGGMKQRIVIAMALSCEPTLLIADEPTSALDVTVQAQILDLISSLQVSILFITHDFGVVAAICDQVAVMYAGKVVEEAPVNALFSSPAHPYTKGLLRAIPQNTSVGQQFETIAGDVPSMVNVELKGCLFQKRCPQAMQICSQTEPNTLQVQSDHLVSCWLYAEKIENKENASD